jgi:hypothetical protein
MESKLILVEASLWPPQCDAKFREWLPNPNKYSINYYTISEPVYVSDDHIDIKSYNFVKVKSGYRPDNNTVYYFYDWKQI